MQDNFIILIQMQKKKKKNTGNRKNTRVSKEQERKRFLSQLGIRTYLLEYYCWDIFCFNCIKMESIVTWLLDGDILMPEMCLRQTGFIYSTCRPFKNNKTGIQRFKETEDIRYIYHSGSDNVCFQHDLAYGARRCLPRKPNFNKISVIENFRLIAILSIVHINQKLPQLSINVMTKNLETVNVNILMINIYPMNYTGLSLENLIHTEYTHVLEISFGVLILQTCS